MKNFGYKIFILFLLFLSTSTFAQYQELSNPRSFPPYTGVHNGNRVAISYHDDGQIAGIIPGVDVRGEWPYGSGEHYIGDCIPLIGVEFINRLNDTLHSVIISRGPRGGQLDEKNNAFNYFWGWNPRDGFRNHNYQSVAMSHLPESYPPSGWNDPIAKNWIGPDGQTQWYGYFGRGIKNADQESLFEADDQWDDEFNFGTGNTIEYIDGQTPRDTFFLPDPSNPNRHGMGLRMRVRGFQWSNFLAEDALFWLYDITNDGKTTYRKANFGTVVGTLAGGDGDSQDDLAYFDVNDWITLSWDSDNRGNRGQKVGYVAYAFLESPGNPFDGIDNDNDSKDPGSVRFTAADFDSTGVIYKTGDLVVLINPDTYERTLHTVGTLPETVYSMGVPFVIDGTRAFREGWITRFQQQGVNRIAIPHATALDGIDNDLDGLIDENEAVHFFTRQVQGKETLKYKNYRTGSGINDLMIDERRDNNIDEDGDWDARYDDLGIDGLGFQDAGYPGPDAGEGNGIPDQGEPNFGRTDPDESDQIGLTSFNFFQLEAGPDLNNDANLWDRMEPGRFDIVPPQPQDGDFIYASGYFPLIPANGNPEVKERFSVALLFGEDRQDVLNNKTIVQQIYNAGYKFPQPPTKPKINIAQENGKVVIYWNGKETETSRDFLTKKEDFQGYKIYRATDLSFQDARTITNASGNLAFDKPMVQYDLNDTIKGYFYPGPDLLQLVGGTTFYLGDNTGVVNRFVDSSVVLGQTYYYAVTAYDAGDPNLGIFPTENTKFIRRAITGEIITDDNTAVITPGSRPAGYRDANVNEFIKSENFVGTGNINIEVIDDAAIKNGYRYQLAFQDTGLARLASTWSLLDLQTPDTVFIPTTNETVIVNPMETINIPSNTDSILVNGKSYFTSSNTYTAPYDTLVDREQYFLGNTPIVDGFRIQIQNNSLRIDTSKSGFKNVQIDPSVGPRYTASVRRETQQSRKPNEGVQKPGDYVIEFSNSIVDTSVADTLLPRANPDNLYPATPVTFRVKNLTENKYIDFAYRTSSSPLTTFYTIIFREDIGGKVYRTWTIQITYLKGNQKLPESGTLELYTIKPFVGTDKITFALKGAEINKEAAATDMNKIQVVPNPYVVTHAAESRLQSSQTGRGEREIRFTHIPPNSKIFIYTVRGELIKTLTHEDLYVGDVYWNLRTEENIDVAFGVYIYVVESENIGKKIGKFALIK